MDNAIADILVSDVMNKHPITVKENTKLKIAIQTLVNKRIAGAPVITEHGTIVGVTSEKDLLVAAASGAHNTPLPYAAKIDVINKNAKLKDALMIILKNNRKWLPVVDDHKKVVGILARRDLLGVFLKRMA
jgi:osmoprotectant transport system ATP-binding protein